MGGKRKPSRAAGNDASGRPVSFPASETLAGRQLAVVNILQLLLIVEVTVIPVFGKQLPVGALFHDLTLIQYNNGVKIKQRENAVCDDDGGFILEETI